MVMVRMTPIRPGTMLCWVSPFGVVELVHAHLERRRPAGERRERPGQVLAGDRRRELAHRRDRGAGGGGIGRVRLDQQRRPLAAQQLAREVGREIDDELHLAAGERGARRLLGRQLRDEVEVAARSSSPTR